ncbi:MAG: Lrp/AsnC family transcriptional regulator [Omnitrophica bacterium]|nr:Lrp/AsnC family transcriptional regulator [Candidatus Omnitrophota bacterium]
MRLSALDRKILNCIQQDIPLASEPFKILSNKLGIKEDELLCRIKDLKQRGIIRTFCAGINHRRLGFASSLIALKLPANRVEAVAKEIVKYQEITHCFLREGEYNLWMVFLSPQKQNLKRFFNKMVKKIGKENVLSLPTRKKFKLRNLLKI